MEAMPDEARTWVFAAPERLTTEQAEALLGEVDRFIEGWLAHGRSVVGARELRDDIFLLVAADEAATGVSGCSIDSLFRALQALEARLGTSLTDRSLVWLRDGTGAVRSMTRTEFKEAAARGEVGRETTVFDTTVTSVGGVRSGAWERPAGESWHARMLASA
jgi:hypothetical protein